MDAWETVHNNAFRYVKYNAVSFVGFIIVESITYITLETGINELLGVTGAYAASMLVTFIVDSVFTVKSGSYARPKIPFGKLHLFVISGALANAGYILFQYYLFTHFGLSPLIGNLLGGAFITPTNYYFRMRSVWGRKVIF